MLRAFLSDPLEPRFGFGLMEALKMSSGTLYPILARLRKAGWVRVETEDIDPSVEGRPARRYYHLTPKGQIAAVRELNRMSALYAAPPRSGCFGYRGVEA